MDSTARGAIFQYSIPASSSQDAGAGGVTLGPTLAQVPAARAEAGGRASAGDSQLLATECQGGYTHSLSASHRVTAVATLEGQSDATLGPGACGVAACGSQATILESDDDGGEAGDGEPATGGPAIGQVLKGSGHGQPLQGAAPGPAASIWDPPGARGGGTSAASRGVPGSPERGQSAAEAACSSPAVPPPPSLSAASPTLSPPPVPQGYGSGLEARLTAALAGHSRAGRTPPTVTQEEQTAGSFATLSLTADVTARAGLGTLSLSGSAPGSGGVVGVPHALGRAERRTGPVGESTDMGPSLSLSEPSHGAGRPTLRREARAPPLSPLSPSSASLSSFGAAVEPRRATGTPDMSLQSPPSAAGSTSSGLSQTQGLPSPHSSASDTGSAIGSRRSDTAEQSEQGPDVVESQGFEQSLASRVQQALARAAERLAAPAQGSPTPPTQPRRPRRQGTKRPRALAALASHNEAPPGREDAVPGRALRARRRTVAAALAATSGSADRAAAHAGRRASAPLKAKRKPASARAAPASQASTQAPRSTAHQRGEEQSLPPMFKWRPTMTTGQVVDWLGNLQSGHGGEMQSFSDVWVGRLGYVLLTRWLHAVRAGEGSAAWKALWRWWCRHCAGRRTACDPEEVLCSGPVEVSLAALGELLVASACSGPVQGRQNEAAPWCAGLTQRLQLKLGDAAWQGTCSETGVVGDADAVDGHEGVNVECILRVRPLCRQVKPQQRIPLAGQRKPASLHTVLRDADTVQCTGGDTYCRTLSGLASSVADWARDVLAAPLGSAGTVPRTFCVANALLLHTLSAVAAWLDAQVMCRVAGEALWASGSGGRLRVHAWGAPVPPPRAPPPLQLAFIAPAPSDAGASPLKSPPAKVRAGRGRQRRAAPPLLSLVVTVAYTDGDTLHEDLAVRELLFPAGSVVRPGLPQRVQQSEQGSPSHSGSEEGTVPADAAEQLTQPCPAEASVEY